MTAYQTEMTLMEADLCGSHFNVFPLGSFPSVLAVPVLAVPGCPWLSLAVLCPGFPPTASCILANNSMKLGRSLAWDPEEQLVAGDSEANALLRQKYRAPYTHPEA